MPSAMEDRGWGRKDPGCYGGCDGGRRGAECYGGATRWGWGGQKELSSVKGKECGQEGRMVLWRVGAGAGEGPHGTRAAMRCLRQWGQL